MNKEKVNNLIKQPLVWGLVGLIVVVGIVLSFDLSNNDALRINDTVFSRNELNQIANQITQEFEMYGVSATKEEIKQETVDRAIQQTLILDYAKERGIEVTQEEINDQINQIMGMYQFQEEQELLDLLREQGISSRKELENLLSLEIKIDKLVELYSEEVDVTEEEARQAYDDYAQQMEGVSAMGEMDQEILTFKEMENDLKTQIAGEKVAPLLLSKIEELKEEAEIEIYIDIDDLDIREPEVDEQQPQMEIDPEEFDIEEIQ